MEIAGQYVFIPTTGMVSAGMGTVWENCTCGMPMQNPTNQDKGEGQFWRHMLGGLNINKKNQTVLDVSDDTNTIMELQGAKVG